MTYIPFSTIMPWKLWNSQFSLQFSVSWGIVKNMCKIVGITLSRAHNDRCTWCGFQNCSRALKMGAPEIAMGRFTAIRSDLAIRATRLGPHGRPGKVSFWRPGPNGRAVLRLLGWGRDGPGWSRMGVWIGPLTMSKSRPR